MSRRKQLTRRFPSICQRSSIETLEDRLLFSTYTVTTLGDGAGSVTPNGAGKFNATTLRAAINAANTAGGADTINFNVTGTINLLSALPNINDTLTITGPGASNLTVQRGTAVTASFGVLRLNAGKTASVSGLRLSRGAGTLVGTDRVGGGVFNAGNLALTNCTLSDNQVVGADGTAATSTTAPGNGRRGLGGAIYNTGTLTLKTCTLSGNTAAGGQGGYQPSQDQYSIAGRGGDAIGGAIYNTGNLTITGSTLSNNTATGGTGGEHQDFSGIGGNGGDSRGGAIYNLASTAVTSSTLSGNQANAGKGSFGRQGGIGGASGGGAIDSTDGTTLSARSCTFSNNRANAGAAGDGLFGAGSPGRAAGGAISGGGIFLITGGTFSANQANGGAGGGSTGGTIPDGNSSGGAVTNSGTMTLLRTTFTNNQVRGSDTSGGALWNPAGATAVIEQCAFTTNSVLSSVESGAARGGAINNAGTASLRSCNISGNSAEGATGGGYGGTGQPGLGGGIYNVGGATLVIAASTIANNAAIGGEGHPVSFPSSITPRPGGTALGGGLANDGNASLVDTTLSGNKATGGDGIGEGCSGGGANGAGIWSDGTLDVVSCTVSGNLATGGSGYDGFFSGGYGGTAVGGGIRADGTTTLYNSTITGNRASGSDGGNASPDPSYARPGGDGGSGFGGGLAAEDTFTVVNCTISGNTVTAGEGGTGSAYGGEGGPGADGTAAGGGMSKAIANLQVSNTIVVGNTRTLGGVTTVNEILGTLAPGSINNVVGTIGTGGLTNGVNGNQVGITLAALKLGPLADNGGTTRTMALLSGSPAINAGNNASAVSANLQGDQRGFKRFRDVAVDVGAFETQPTPNGSIAGVFYNDLNKNGSRQAGEFGLVGWQAYIDTNNNGIYDPGEMNAFSVSGGGYKIQGLPAGTYRVREVRLEGWVRTQPPGAFPSGFYDVTVNLAVNGGAVVGRDFGNFLT